MELKAAIMEVLAEGGWKFYDPRIGIHQMLDFADRVAALVTEEDEVIRCDCHRSLASCKFPGCPAGERIEA